MRVRNAASRNPARSGLSALRPDFYQGPLARRKASRASGRLLRTLSNMGSLVRSNSVCLHSDQLFARKMASAKAFWNRSLYRCSAESGAARNFQIPSRDREQQFGFIIAKTLASCPATRDLILDLPGDELSL